MSSNHLPRNSENTFHKWKWSKEMGKKTWKLEKKFIYLFSFVWKVFAKWVFPWMIANVRITMASSSNHSKCKYSEFDLILVLNFVLISIQISNCYFLLMKTKIQNFRIMLQLFIKLKPIGYGMLSIDCIQWKNETISRSAHGKYSKKWIVNFYRLNCIEFRFKWLKYLFQID